MDYASEKWKGASARNLPVLEDIIPFGIVAGLFVGLVLIVASR